MRRLYRAVVPRPVRWFVRTSQHRLGDLGKWFVRTSRRRLGDLSRAFRRPWQVLQGHLELLLGRRDPLVPPRYLWYVGDGDFAAVGEEYLRHFVALGGLQPDDAVLDVGCGIGRMARPLTRYLSDHGSYEGFDIVPVAIKWCTANITRRRPDFRFRLADLRNAMYRPRGRFKASEYRFPYPENSFDFVFLVSVLTHMLPDDMENYLREVARVLRPGKRCFVTFFLLNDDSRRLMAQGATSQTFHQTEGGVYTTQDSQPEQLVAYDEAAVRQLCARYGLRVVDPIHYGWWRQCAAFLSYQDIIVAEKA